MGREARRVPIDFDWPLNQVWNGYLLPEHFHEQTCPDCDHGLTADGQLIQGIAYMIVGLGDDVFAQERGHQLHPCLQPIHEISYVQGQPRPTARFEELIKGLFADDEYDKPHWIGRQPYRMARRLMELAGLDEHWGWCPTCEGHASIEKYPGQRAEAEAWEGTEPPTGDGWQLWETTSEGSPQTPVFTTAEDLADHCAEHGVSWFGSETATREQWLKVITGEDIAFIEIAPGVVMM